MVEKNVCLDEKHWKGIFDKRLLPQILNCNQVHQVQQKTSQDSPVRTKILNRQSLFLALLNMTGTDSQDTRQPIMMCWSPGQSDSGVTVVWQWHDSNILRTEDPAASDKDAQLPAVVALVHTWESGSWMPSGSDFNWKELRVGWLRVKWCFSTGVILEQLSRSAYQMPQGDRQWKKRLKENKLHKKALRCE